MSVTGILNIGTDKSYPGVPTLYIDPDCKEFRNYNGTILYNFPPKEEIYTIDSLLYGDIIHRNINMIILNKSSLLKGADESLHHIDYVITDDDCLELLKGYGFYRENGSCYRKLVPQNQDLWLWNRICHKVRTVLSIGSSPCIDYDPDKEYHYLGSNTKDAVNVFSTKKELAGVDDYCKKLDIKKVDLLYTDSVIINGERTLEHVDFVIFDGVFENLFPTLQTKGFRYCYTVFGESLNNICKGKNKYVAMRTSWKEAFSPVPKIGIECINLETSVDRRKHVSEQLDKLGLSYSIFNAINGKMVNIEEHFIEYAGTRYLYNPVRKMSYGEIGCALSHYLVYKKLLLTDNDYFLVLEDDNIITDINFARNQLYNIPKTYFDVCLLSQSIQSPMFVNEKINEYYMKLQSKRFNLASSLIFSRKCLEKLVNYIETKGITHVADDFVEMLVNSENLELIIAKNRVHQIDTKRFRSNIWNIYKENEPYWDIKNDKPVYNKTVAFDQNTCTGRFANKLFQYATVKAISLDHNLHICFRNNELKPLRNANSVSEVPSQYINIIETKFSYEPEILANITSENNYLVQGYFQTYKYFEKYRDIILNCFELDRKMQREAKNICLKYSGISRETCGVHIRLPDTRGETGFIYTSPSEKYLKEAISIILGKNPNTLFIVCSSDIEECVRLYRNIFPPGTVFYSKGKYEDFTLLTVCDNNIVTAGSYGWWAAYMNKNKNKTIIGMSPNFNKDVERVRINDETDYYPSDWKILQN